MVKKQKQMRLSREKTDIPEDFAKAFKVPARHKENPKLNSETLGKIEACMKLYATLEETAVIVGVSAALLRQWRSKYPLLQEQMDRWQLEASMKVRNQLHKAIGRGDMRAVFHYMKNMDPQYRATDEGAMRATRTDNSEDVDPTYL